MTTAAGRQNHEPGQFLFVTWDGGGNVHPALGLARRLVARGHSVRVLGQRTLRQRIEAAGAAFRPLPLELEWDASRGRAWEDEGQREYARALVAGMPMAETVLAEVDSEPADVLIVDAFLRSALSAAERTRLPTAALLHVRYRFRNEVTDPTLRVWDYDPVNEVRRLLGLEPIHQDDELLAFKLWQRCNRILAVVPKEFEDFEGPLPRNLRYVGPVFEGDDENAALHLPWPPDHSEPLVVVAFSTTYMRHEGAVGRVLAALATLPVRVLFTPGGGLEPGAVTLPPGIVVRPYVPHAMLFPRATLVVTHAGMGTVMAAFASGVPMLCMPFGRDQTGNAAKVEALNAGKSIAPDASIEEIRSAVEEILSSDNLRAGAQRMAEIVTGYRRHDLATEELESLLTSSRSGLNIRAGGPTPS